jgi:hypothetical protein
MLAKAGLICIGVAMSLGGLAIGIAEFNQGQGAQSDYLELIAWILIALCLIVLVAGLLFLAACPVVFVYRYFHAVRMMPGQCYPHYWPLQRIAQVSGILMKHERWAGDVKLICQADFGSGEVVFTRTVGRFESGTPWIEFPQQPVNFLDHPKEGDTAIIVVRAIPQWWRGRSGYLIQRAPIGVTDHRPAEATE